MSSVFVHVMSERKVPQGSGEASQLVHYLWIIVFTLHLFFLLVTGNVVELLVTPCNFESP
jgi:hypothetical protein